MRRLATLIFALTLTSACGGKDTPPATPDAPAPATTSPPETTTPPTVDATEPAATADVGAEPSAPAADAETPPPEDAGTSATAPPEGWPEGWEEKLAKGGCLGVSAKGDTAWIVAVAGEGDAVTRALFRMSLDGEDPGDSTALTATAGEALTAELREALGDGAKGMRGARPLGKDQVSVGDDAVTLVGGDRSDGPVTVYRWSADPDAEATGARLRVVAACEAEPGGNAFFLIEERLVRIGEGDAEVVDPPSLWPIAIDTWERGTAPCMAIPAGTAPAAELPKATVESMTDAQEAGCVALAADGSYALFHTFREEGVPFDDVEDTSDHDVEVIAAPGVEAPDIDADCVIGGCKGAAKKKLEARVAALDLRQCPKVEAVVVGDRRLPVVSEGDFALEIDGRARTIVALTVGGQDGEDHEQLTSVHQHPKGGPVFVVIDNWDTGLHERRVAVVGLSEMGFCVPEGAAPKGEAAPDGGAPEPKGADAAPACPDAQRVEIDLAGLRGELRAGEGGERYADLIASLGVDALGARCDLETLEGHLEGPGVANTVALVTCAAKESGALSQSFMVLRAEGAAPTTRWCMIHGGASKNPWAREAPGGPLMANAPSIAEDGPDPSTACWRRAPTTFALRLAPLVAPDRQALIVDARYGSCGEQVVAGDDVRRHVFAVEDGKLAELYRATLEKTSFCRGFEPLAGEWAEIEPVGGFPRALRVARTSWCGPAGFAGTAAQCEKLIAGHEGFVEAGPGVMPPAPWQLPEAGREACADETKVSWLRYDRGLYVAADGPPKAAGPTAGALPTTPWIDGARSGAKPDATPFAPPSELAVGCVAESTTLGTVLCVLPKPEGTAPAQKQLVVLGVDGAVRAIPATPEALKAELERGAYTALGKTADDIHARDLDGWTVGEASGVALRPPNDSEAAFSDAAKGYEHPDAIKVPCGMAGELRLYRAHGGGRLRVRQVLTTELGASPLLLEAPVGYAALLSPRTCEVLAQLGGVVAIDRPAPPAMTADAYVAAGRKATAEKHYAIAIRHFDAALRDDPALAPALSGRGYAYLQAGHVFAARADLTRALTLSDDAKFRAAVEHNLAAVAEKLGAQ